MNHKIQKSYVSATSFAFYKVSVEILKRIESFCSLIEQANKNEKEIAKITKYKKPIPRKKRRDNSNQPTIKKNTLFLFKERLSYIHICF